jgi:hypothetical protein
MVNTNLERSREMIKLLEREKMVRDQALEEACQIVDTYTILRRGRLPLGIGGIGAIIRARKADPFAPATPAYAQRMLGNVDAVDP